MAKGGLSLAVVHARMRAIAQSSVKVGLLQNAGSAPDGTSLVEIGAVHEFGPDPTGPLAGHFPQRSWLRATFRRTDEARKKFTANLVQQVLRNESMTPERALGLLGQWAVARVKETIVKRLTEGPENQANAQSTIDAKGSSTPLLDTAHLKNAISYQVVSK